MKNTRLRNALIYLDMTQRQAADKAGIPEAYISMYFHGKYIFTEEQKDKISQTLNFSKTELFDEASTGWPYEETPRT